MWDDITLNKHFNVEDRQRRFDRKSKYGGCHGKSVVIRGNVKCSRIPGFCQMSMAVVGDKADDGYRKITQFDLDVEDFRETPIREDYHYGHRKEDISMGKKRRFDLVSVLEEYAVLTKTLRCGERYENALSLHRVNDSLRTTSIFTLPTVGEVAESALEETRIARNLRWKNTLWIAPCHIQPRVVESGFRAVVQTDGDIILHTGEDYFDAARRLGFTNIPIPEALDDAERDSSLLRKARINGGRFKMPTVNRNDAGCYFNADRDNNGRGFLEVDLGSNCLIKSVSTQGRYPPTNGQLRGVMRGGDYVYNCFTQHGWEDAQNWVTRYELLYRVASGREWNVYDCFKGNHDVFTEVRHTLSSPIFARYLRFKPLTHHRHPYMRIGVYGKRVGEETKQDDGNSVVRYVVAQRSEDANLRRVLPTSILSYACHCREKAPPLIETRQKRHWRALDEIDAFHRSGNVFSMPWEPSVEEDGDDESGLREPEPRGDGNAMGNEEDTLPAQDEAENSLLDVDGGSHFTADVVSLSHENESAGSWEYVSDESTAEDWAVVN